MVLSKTITCLFYVTNSVTADFEVSAAQLEARAHCRTERNRNETKRYASFWRVLERALRNDIEKNRIPDGFMT
jgi:hypothetical protein